MTAVTPSRARPEAFAVLDTNPAARRSITFASIPPLRLERSLVSRRAHDPSRYTGFGARADPPNRDRG